MKNLMRTWVALFVALVLISAGLFRASPVVAQTPSLPPPPYNVDLGAVISKTTLTTASTILSANQTNLANRGVLCKLMETLSSGSPSTTFTIQSFDAASASWATLATSGAVTGYSTAAESTTGQSVLVYPGATLTTTPTGWVLESVPLPRTWRVSMVIGSGTAAAGPAMAGTIGCNYLK